MSETDIDEQSIKDQEAPIVFEPKTKNGKLKVDSWSDKNGTLTPRDVSKKSRKKCWFLCDICSHNFCRTIAAVTTYNKWCQYCEEGEVCGDDDCEICYNRSFASFGEE